MTIPDLPRNILLVYRSVPPDSYWRYQYALRLIRGRSVAAEAQARIEKIHVDFRTDLIYHYETVTGRIRDLFSPLASERNRHGIVLPPQAA